MRRSDREITDRAGMEDILRRGKVCRLGLLRDGCPYIVPMCYGYEDGFLYFHSAAEGLKVECLKACSRVCFEIDCDVTVRTSDEACGWTMGYGSVIGYGTVSEVEGYEDRLRAMNILMKQYSGKDGWEMSLGQLENLLVMKMEITGMTGKRS